jgi:hypothetical protein
MTIPDDPRGAPEATGTAGPARPRVRRPQPERTAPQRSRATGAGLGETSRDPAADPTISEAVSQAVKMGYDVITDNIRQGRQAAERFRHGEYNMREVPGDLETAGLRLLQLARELSTTTFDVCERLLKELGSGGGATDRTTEAPPFRPTVTRSAPPAPTPDPGLMRLTTRFAGGAAATSHTPSLNRPKQPTMAADVTASPLARREPGAEPISGIAFQTDLAVEGLIAVVTIPQGQPPGVYVGLVFAKGQDVPLGALTVEVAA